jgi:cytidine deaminase
MLKEDGGFVQGANVECASYGKSCLSLTLRWCVSISLILSRLSNLGGAICAERTAIVKAVSTGTKKFIGLAVTS